LEPQLIQTLVCAINAINPPCAIRLPHASVGLDFWTIFSANIVYFRAFSSVLRKHKTKNALAGAFSAVTCSQNSLVLLSEFSACLSVLPRSFFLLFGSFFFFLSRKKEEKRTKKIFSFVFHKISVLNQFDFQIKQFYKSKFE